jgi:hypothetical protein
MRGRVCRLQLLLTLSSAVVVGSESRGLMTIFYRFRFETTPTNLDGHVPVLYPQEQGGPVILLGTGFPFRRLL